MKRNVTPATTPATATPAPSVPVFQCTKCGKPLPGNPSDLASYPRQGRSKGRSMCPIGKCSVTLTNEEVAAIAAENDRLSVDAGFMFRRDPAGKAGAYVVKGSDSKGSNVLPCPPDAVPVQTDASGMLRVAAFPGAIVHTVVLAVHVNGCWYTEAKR